MLETSVTDWLTTGKDDIDDDNEYGEEGTQEQ